MTDDREAATTAPVLVTGATGNVGREVVAFDFQDPDTFAAAAAGASDVFLLRPPAISKVRLTLHAFVDVAVDQGVGHVVFLSVIGADKNSIVRSDAYRLDIRDAEHHGQGYTLTGPEAVTFKQLAIMLTQVLGRPIRYGLSFAHRVVQTILHVGLSYGDGRPTCTRMRSVSHLIESPPQRCALIHAAVAAAH